MKLYVANTTKNPHDFMYRLPERTQVFRVIIRAGTQTPIHGDNVSTDDVEAIISQHLMYGLTNVQDIDRTKQFVGLCYSLNEPVSQDVIARVIERNDEIRARESQESRALAVASLHDLTQRQAQEGMLTKAPEGIEVEIEEERTGPTDNRAAGDRLHQTIQSAIEGSNAAQKQGQKRDLAR